MKKKLVLALIVTGVVTASVFGCGKKEDAAAASSEAAAEAETVSETSSETEQQAEAKTQEAPAEEASTEAAEATTEAADTATEAEEAVKVALEAKSDENMMTYSEGMAWFCVRVNGQTRYALVNTEGEAVKLMEGEWVYVTPMLGGAAAFYDMTSGTTVMVDKDGNELYRDENPDDVLLGYLDDGTIFVSKQKSGFAENTTTVEVIDSSGNVTGQVEMEVPATKGLKLYKGLFARVADGVYAADFDKMILINTNTGHGFLSHEGFDGLTLDGNYVGISGYKMMTVDDFVNCANDDDLQAHTVRTTEDLPLKCDRNSAGYVSWRLDERYDATPEERASLRDGDGNVVFQSPTIPDQAYIVPEANIPLGDYACWHLQGADGYFYIGFTDHEGNFLFDPVKTESSRSGMNNGWLCYTGRDGIDDLTLYGPDGSKYGLDSEIPEECHIPLFKSESDYDVSVSEGYLVYGRVNDAVTVKNNKLGVEFTEVTLPEGIEISTDTDNTSAGEAPEATAGTQDSASQYAPATPASDNW